MGASGRGDASVQLREGIRLIKRYQQILVRDGMAPESPALPNMVRFAHNTGIGAARGLLAAMARARLAGVTGTDPSIASWDEIVRWAADHRPEKFLEGMRTADYAMLAGQEIERRVTEPSR